MPIKISRWYGRLGNNIQQCAIGILIAKKRNDTFQNINHDIIKPIELDFRKDKRDRLSDIYLNDFFYWNGYIRSPNISTFRVYRDIQKICQQYILPKLDIPKVHVSNDTLVIHIRSGDLFEEGMTFYNFIPNPYQYYVKLIDLYTKVLVVTEKDKKNPVLDKLKDNPKVIIQTASIKEDFSVLLGAKNLATSGISTFPIAAALCSENLKNLYCSENFDITALNYKMISSPKINIYECELKNYIKKGSWRNNFRQRELIMDAKLEIDFRKYKTNKTRLRFLSFFVDLVLFYKKFNNLLKLITRQK